MLRSLKELEKYKASPVDGDIGRVTDFLFDDQHWTIRYLVTEELTRELEGSLHEYFARPQYWTGGDSQDASSKRSVVGAGKP